MAARKDVHCLKNFEPADYTYQGCFDSQPRGCNPDSDGDSDQFWENDYEGDPQMEALLKSNPAMISWKQEDYSYACDHCGTSIRYVCVYRHNPSGQYLAVGNDCSRERFGALNRRELDVKRLAQSAADREERKRFFKAAMEWVQANYPDLEILLTPFARKAGGILLDLAQKLARWGKLTEKQVNFARKLIVEQQERDDNGGKSNRELALAEEKAKAADCPDGQRVTVSGVVLKVDSYESEFGTQLKWAVKDDSGFVVWCSVPSRIEGDEKGYDYKGKRVQFSVALTRSGKDPKFGFGKRPTKAKMLEPELVPA